MLSLRGIGKCLSIQHSHRTWFTNGTHTTLFFVIFQFPTILSHHFSLVASVSNNTPWVSTNRTRFGSPFFSGPGIHPQKQIPLAFPHFPCTLSFPWFTEGFYMVPYFQLVGGWPTPLNIFVNWEYYSQYGKIKHVPNHQPDDIYL